MAFDGIIPIPTSESGKTPPIEVLVEDEQHEPVLDDTLATGEESDAEILREDYLIETEAAPVNPDLSEVENLPEVTPETLVEAPIETGVIADSEDFMDAGPHEEGPYLDTNPAMETESLAARAANKAREVFNRDNLDSVLNNTGEKVATGIEHVRGFLNERNLDTFEGLSDKAKSFASWAYEGVYKTPGINKLVANREIAWSQMLIDMKQKKASKFNNEIAKIDAEAETNEVAADAIRSSIEILKNTNPATAAKQERALEKLAAKKSQLDTNRARYEAKVTDKNGSIENFVNKRDAIAEKMMSVYDKDLRPLEAKMDILNTQKDSVEFHSAVARAELVNCEDRISTLEQKRNTLLHNQQLSRGSDKRDLGRAIKEFDNIIDAQRKQIALTENNIAAQEEAIRSKITKVELKMRPYQDRRDVFVSVTNRSEQTTNVPDAAPLRNFDGDFSNFDESVEMSDSSRHGIGTLLEKWNDYLDTHHEEKARTKIDPAEFLRRANWNENIEVDFDNFLDIIKRYYKVRGINTKSIALLADDFKNKEEEIDS